MAVDALWVVFFPFGLTTVVVRLDSHGLSFVPGRHSHTVGDSCADGAAEEALPPAKTADTIATTTQAHAVRARRVMPAVLAVRRGAPSPNGHGPSCP